ncbi:hypothetical protein JTB14_019473 [Gonioctena quinquepunctata]|nr:hypothetical protein JTB14_019473 [Gonioctena quinquepunctata]
MTPRMPTKRSLRSHGAQFKNMDTESEQGLTRERAQESSDGEGINDEEAVQFTIVNRRETKKISKTVEAEPAETR